MRLCLSFIFFLCAPYGIDCALDAGCDFQFLTVSIEPNPILQVYFKGKSDEDYSNAGYLHMQMYDITNGEPTTPVERQLESHDSPVQLESSNTYSVSFPYKAGEGDNDINFLMKKKLRLYLFIQESTEGALISSGTVDADLTDVEEFPTTPDVKYIEDVVITDGRLIRVDDPNTLSTVNFEKVCTSSNPAPCYVYEGSITATKYAQCYDIRMIKGKAASPDLYLCSGEGSDPIEIVDSGDVPTQIILDHHTASGLEVVHAANTHTIENIDLVIQDPDNILKCCSKITPSSDGESQCKKQKFGQDNKEYKIFIVSYDAGIPKNYYYTAHEAQNNDLRQNFLSMEILEASWFHEAAGEKQQYFVTRKEGDDSDTVLTKAYVDCTAVADPCNSYFVNMQVAGSYYVTLQDYVAPKLATVMVKSGEKIRPPSKSHENSINIQYETNTANDAEQNIIVNVCFDHFKNITMEDTYYELLVVNSNGQWKRETEVNMKSDSYACFHSVELSDAHFKDNSKALVMLRDSNNRNVLASGEVKIQVPEPALAHTGDNMGNTSNNTVWIIVGTSAGFLTCLVALVALIYTKIIRNGESDDRIQYPLHRTIIENDNIAHGLDNPASTI